MQANDELHRQALGCGYLPPTDRVRLSVWQPPSGNDRCGYKGPRLTVCAGYTCNLPEVSEVALARAVAKHSDIGHLCEGKPPTEDLLQAIVVLDCEYSALEGWLMTPAADGGGGS